MTELAGILDIAARLAVIGICLYLAAVLWRLRARVDSLERRADRHARTIWPLSPEDDLDV